MFTIKSSMYDLIGFDESTKKWVFEGKPNPEETESTICVNQAKFIDKASGLAYFLDKEGNKNLTYASQRQLLSM